MILSGNNKNLQTTMDAGSVATLMLCPPLYAAGKIKQRLKEERERLYGAGAGDAALGLLLLVLSFAFVVGLWIYPMIKAFRCPNNGMVWGLLILFSPFYFPFMGLIYLFVGCKTDASAVPPAESS